jgi:threonine dehydratase
MERSMSAGPFTFDMIEQARQRMGNHLPVTPLSFGSNLSALLGGRVWLKLENLQVTGSFKERGALNRLLQLNPEERARGVIAASAGNHAQGVALHAQRLGVPATIVMPEPTPLMKVSRTRRHGAQVVLHGATYDEAWEHAVRLGEERGLTYVHAFDDLEVMAGQGTIGLEMLEQNPYLQQVVVPIGGGGLIAGIATAIKETNPRIRIIGVQSESFPSMREAVRHGTPVEVVAGRTIAEGIAVRRAGHWTLPVVQNLVDDIVTVSDEEIARAILLLMEEEKVVAEGAGAAGVAALLSGRCGDLASRRTGVVICGGNIDTNLISTIIERGLVQSGRRARLSVVIPDQPGNLARLAEQLALSRANILQIRHERDTGAVALGETDVDLVLETRGFEHLAEVERRLSEQGYAVRRTSSVE